jgi:hypothetical protein
MKWSFVLSLLLFAGVTSLHGQGNKKDYYHVPQPIKFDNKQYYLSDSYHPQDNYYKQEYIPKGETADRFNTMVTIDVLIGNQSVKDMVTQKVAELETVQKTNPVVHYKVYEHPEKGEYILDFVLSEGEPNISVVEWNTYRYTSYKDKSGKKGVMLFAYSWRGYDSEVKSFFEKLKTKRMDYVNMIGAYTLPVIQLSN